AGTGPPSGSAARRSHTYRGPSERKGRPRAALSVDQISIRPRSRRSEADAGAGEEEVEVLDVSEIIDRTAERVVLVGKPELHRGRVDVLDDTDTPMLQLVA